MKHEINKKRLFYACSIALVVTAMTFSIRAGLLGTLGTWFSLSPKEIGEVAAAAFWGFTLAMFLGGPLCDIIGLKRMYLVAFLAHLAGIILTISATGYWSLFLSTLLVGIGNGCIESASYTLVSSMYTNDKARKINDWHIWFPGGIVIGGILAYLCSLAHIGWQWQMALMIVPTIVYGYMFFGQAFPSSERVSLGISNKGMIRECGRPMFIFMLLCMLLTAATELGTNQWIAELLSNIGVPAILLLVFINGIMVIGRANAGAILKRISATGVLFLSAVLSFTGLLWLGYAQGYTAFVAAGIFAAGICFFWPTMIGFVAENLYKTGPLGLSLMGGVGLLSTALVLPYMGQLYASQMETATQQLAIAGVDAAQLADQSKLIAGAYTLRYVAVLPGILIVAFGALHLYMRKRRQSLPTIQLS
ncbi:MFS transporter [Chitinophaga sp. MM2321]|uniref:MFS transporter n=1 Tax=Chitinophaga sp. MM2321 TaxID=3137178 RepID=UPI0032D5B036